MNNEPSLYEAISQSKLEAKAIEAKAKEKENKAKVDAAMKKADTATKALAALSVPAVVAGVAFSNISYDDSPFIMATLVVAAPLLILYYAKQAIFNLIAPQNCVYETAIEPVIESARKDVSEQKSPPAKREPDPALTAREQREAYRDAREALVRHEAAKDKARSKAYEITWSFTITAMLTALGLVIWGVVTGASIPSHNLFFSVTIALAEFFGVPMAVAWVVSLMENPLYRYFAPPELVQRKFSPSRIEPSHIPVTVDEPNRMQAPCSSQIVPNKPSQSPSLTLVALDEPSHALVMDSPAIRQAEPSSFTPIKPDERSLLVGAKYLFWNMSAYAPSLEDRNRIEKLSAFLVRRVSEMKKEAEMAEMASRIGVEVGRNTPVQPY